MMRVVLTYTVPSGQTKMSIIERVSSGQGFNYTLCGLYLGFSKCQL